MIDEPAYAKAYDYLQDKGYMDYEDLRKFFPKGNIPTIKDNFDSLDMLIWDDILKVPRVKKDPRDPDFYTVVVIRPCRDKSGKWIN